jgi:hypothetical protein
MPAPSAPQRSALRAAFLAAQIPVLLAAGVCLAAPARQPLPRVVKSPSGVWAFTTVTDATTLVECLLGDDIMVRNAVLTAPEGAAGTFLGGLDVVGFDGGVALSTGTIEGALGPNSEFGDTGTDHLAPGDAALDQLVDPESTYDACILEFEFYTEVPEEIEFDYVFASEEYSEFVGQGFDDVLAFFLNGTGAAQNIARVDEACATTTGVPTSVDNVNCGNATDPGVVAVNCACYRNNEVDFTTYPPPPTPLDSEMDGFTLVFKARGTTVAGWNTLKIGIADAGDGILDSNVFIRCSSFVVPVESPTWGGLKTRYR